MMMCRLAIPFLVSSKWQNTAFLWPLRSAVIEWKDSELTAFETSYVDHAMNIITFARVGKPSMSKSKLVNAIISDINPHPTFFHKDCKHGKAQRYVANKTVELAYYLTSGRTSDKLPQELTILNLRGDLAACDKLVPILEMLSSIFVIFLEFKDMDTLIRNVSETLNKIQGSTFIFVIFVKEDHDEYDDVLEYLDQIIEDAGGEDGPNGYLPFDVDEGNDESIPTDICEFLSEKLIKYHSHPANSLVTKLNSCDQMHLKIDEACIPQCKVGKKSADAIMSEIRRYDGSDNIRDILLPLQGPKWLKWGQLLKKKHRAGGILAEGKMFSQKDELDQEMDEIMIQQKKETESLKPNGPMAEFLKVLMDNDDPVVLLYFLKWLQIGLDEVSRHHLPKLSEEYMAKHKELQKITDQKDKSKQDELEKDLENIKCRLSHFVIGIEHFMREMALFYQVMHKFFPTTVELQDSILNTEFQYYRNLPDKVASLLLAGHPLEILDGDASVVPTEWVSEILQKLADKVGKDKKVFVLSVIGIQSSGKSTLLNAMFGLEFTVSAGRCTRGIYAQLIKVIKVNTTRLGMSCDYVMVLDSEGLRATEATDWSIASDNELATLVIGLADLTIINLKGENTAEMENILQVVVHAFLRLKLANTHKKQRCIFIHQNVSAVNASTKMQTAHISLNKKLDKMSKVAAEIENIDHKFCSFNQVIEFNTTEHYLWYFQDLWNGNPPMAPINIGYYENVVEVKKHLIGLLSKSHDPPVIPQKACLNLGDLHVRVDDIWNGVLAEDFVFSFKNCMAAKAYTKLDRKVSDLRQNIETNLYEWLNREARVELFECETYDDSRNKFKLLNTQLGEKVNILKEEKLKELDEFFDTEADVHILEESINDIKLKMRLKCRYGETLVQEDLMKIYTEHTSLIESEKRFSSQKEEIKSQLKSIAGTTNADINTDDIFTSAWNAIRQKVEPSSKELRKRILESLETQFGSTHGGYIRTEISNNMSDNIFVCDISETQLAGTITKDMMDTNIHIYYGTGFTGDEETVVDEVIEKSNMILQCVDEQIANIMSTKTSYQHANITPRKTSYQHAADIFQNMLSKFDEYNASNNFRMTTQFKAYLTVHVAKYVIPVLEDMDKKCHMNGSQTKWLDGIKSEMKNFFVLSMGCDTNMEQKDETSADYIVSILMKNFHETIVKHEMHRLLIEEVIHEFKRDKQVLLHNILSTLANGHSYITDAKECAREHLKKHISDCAKSRDKRVLNTIGNMIHKYIAGAKNAVRKATETVSDPNLDAWIGAYRNNISSDKWKMPATSKMFSDKGLYEIININTFTEFMLIKLNRKEETYIEQDNASTNVDIDNVAGKVLEKLWGCDATCPFCNEPCKWTNDGHQGPHECIQHRPTGLQGQVKRIKEKSVWVTAKTSKWLRVETCTMLVCKNSPVQYPCNFIQNKCGCEEKGFHFYRHYDQCFPKWNIPKDDGNSGSKYWKYFMNKHNNLLARIYGVNPAFIPFAWRHINQEDALASLKGDLQVTL